jgi:tRNA 2-selenouridine synthase
LEQPYSLQVLGGYTGSGKTALLQELKNKGEAIIDLEQLANHKGSAFGKVDDGKQPTQELFENRLAIELRNHLQQQSLSPGSVSASIWVEDESQRIGRVNIPNAFWKIMRQSPVYFLDIPFEQRLNYILAEYGTKSTEQLIECTQRLTKRLGGLDTKNTIAFLQEGDLREAFRILLRYYDKTYSKGLHNRENGSTLLHQVESNTVSTDNVSLLLSQYQAL